MDPFMRSYGMRYILVVLEYVSKGVEAVALLDSEGRCVSIFLKRNIYPRFGTLRAIISDDGSQFCNLLFKALLDRYGERDMVEIPYYQQNSRQMEVSNREIKSILVKTMNSNKID